MENRKMEDHKMQDLKMQDQLYWDGKCRNRSSIFSQPHVMLSFLVFIFPRTRRRRTTWNLQ